MQNRPQSWLRPVDAATHIGVTPDTLARWRMNGTGPDYCKAGRLILYSLSQLDDWMHSKAVRSRNSDLRSNEPEAM